MSIVNRTNDIRQFLLFVVTAIREVETVVSKMIEIELAGIKIAAITGESEP